MIVQERGPEHHRIVASPPHCGLPLLQIQKQQLGGGLGLGARGLCCRRKSESSAVQWASFSPGSAAFWPVA